MDTLFFYLSKILWSLAAPDSFLLYLLIAAFICLWKGKVLLAQRLLAVALAGLLLIAFLPIGAWLMYPLEKRFTPNVALPEHVDGIVLLGGSVYPLESTRWNQIELGNAAERNLAFFELGRHYPEAKLVMSGGNGGLLDQEFREADISKQLFDTLGLATERIVFERNSRNTYENAVNSMSLMQPRDGEVWLLITSAHHMPRAVGVFCAQGWPVIAWPVDHQTSPDGLLRLQFNLANNLGLLKTALREWAGLVVYRVTGKTSALLPAGCPLQE